MFRGGKSVGSSMECLVLAMMPVFQHASGRCTKALASGASGICSGWLNFVVQTSIELIYDLPRFVLACAQQGLITARARSSSILLPWCLMAGRGKLFKVCYGRTLASNWLADRSQLRQLRCLLGLEVPHLQECSICSFIVHRESFGPIRFDDTCLQSKPEDAGVLFVDLLFSPFLLFFLIWGRCRRELPLPFWTRKEDMLALPIAGGTDAGRFAGRRAVVPCTAAVALSSRL